MEVQRLLNNEHSHILPERYRLKEAMSPHAAALHEGIHMELSDFILPTTSNHLVVETAGGLMSPMTSQYTVLNGVIFWRKPVVLVSQAYLGSINHTLLCIDALKQHNVPLLGIVYSGQRNEESEAFIQEYTGVADFAHVEHLEHLNAECVSAQAEKMKHSLLGKNILDYFSANA
jgi:dethiobiotin synthetase